MVILLKNAVQRFISWFFLILISALSVSACDTMPAVSDKAGEMVKVEEKAAEPTVQEPRTVVDTEAKIAVEQKKITEHAQLDGESLFNLLAAEFAGNLGDVEASLKYYSEAADSIKDSRVAARAAYIALYGEDYDEALIALDRWSELEPDSTDLLRMYAIVYLKLEKPEKAVSYVEKLLSSSYGSLVDEAMAVKQLLSKEASTKDAHIVLQRLNQREDKNHKKGKHVLYINGDVEWWEA